jgi:putative two-component system response regulator
MQWQQEPPARKPTVLAVDDDPNNLNVVGGLLQPIYDVRVATSGQRALELASKAPLPDLILLDIMMPNMDGHAVLAALKSDPLTRNIPVIFLTAMDASRDEEMGLKHGAVDYITKPLHPEVLLARVRTQLELKLARDQLDDRNTWLEMEVARRMADNEAIQNAGIRALARLAEIRDPETGNHILRTSEYVVTLARLLQKDPRYSGQLSERAVLMLGQSAPLHDIGKVGIPDHILHKPGKLNDEEWVVMRTHTTLGAQAIERAEMDAERPLEFLAIAKTIARWHHENWDGSGYPDGLANDAIPLPAQLMKLADVFDALITRRVYKDAYKPEVVRQTMKEGRGTLFSPVLFDYFETHFDEFVAIAQRLRDDEGEVDLPGMASASLR